MLGLKRSSVRVVSWINMEHDDKATRGTDKGNPFKWFCLNQCDTVAHPGCCQMCSQNTDMRLWQEYDLASWEDWWESLMFYPQMPRVRIPSWAELCSSLKSSRVKHMQKPLLTEPFCPRDKNLKTRQAALHKLKYLLVTSRVVQVLTIGFNGK